MNSRFDETFAPFPANSTLDEREKGVILEGIARAFNVSTFASLLVAIVLALTGSGMWSMLVILSTGIPGAVLGAYCKKHNVDYYSVLRDRSTRSWIIRMVVHIALTIAWIAAIAFHYSTGRPLIDFPQGFGHDDAFDTTWLITGAAIGMLVSILGMWQKTHPSRSRNVDPADIPDED